MSGGEGGAVTMTVMTHALILSLKHYTTHFSAWLWSGQAYEIALGTLQGLFLLT